MRDRRILVVFNTAAISSCCLRLMASARRYHNYNDGSLLIACKELHQ